MKKKLLTIITVAILAVGALVGCGGKSKNNADKYDNDIANSVDISIPKKIRSKIFDGDPEYSKNDENFWYDVYDDCVEIIYLGGLGEKVELPCEYDGKPVRGIGMTYYLDKELVDSKSIAEVKEVVIPDTFWCIDTNGFKDFIGLESIEVPENVVYIAGNAFQDCTSLKEVTLPKSVLHVGSQIAYGCTSIEHVYAKNRNMSLNNDVFSGCELEDFTYID